MSEINSTTVSTWKAKPQEMERLLGAVLPHASSDGYLPMICGVNFEVTGSQLVVAATDRFTLGVAWEQFATWDEDVAEVPPINVSIYAADIRRLLAFARPFRKTASTWALTESGLTVTNGGESLTIRTVDVNFVKWRPLLLKQLSNRGDGTPVMSLNPRFVDSFRQSAKALGEENGKTIWHFGGAAISPTLIRIGDKFVGMLMPQMMEEQPALDLSAIGIELPAVAA